MASVKSILKKVKGKYRVDKNNQSLVFIQYGHGERTKLFSTNVRIDPKYWSGDQNKPIKKSLAGYTTKNALINKVKHNIEESAHELERSGTDPTIDRVALELAKEKAGSENVLKLFKDFIEQSSSNKTEGTIDNYQNALSHLTKFIELKKVTPSLDSITLKFYDSFVEYLAKEGKANSTIGKTVKNLKVFLNHLEKRGYDLNVVTKEMKVFNEPATIVFLTQEELDQLYDYDFSNNPRLERVRDLFALGCATGLRYSDLSRLAKHHIQGNLIKMKAYKNEKQITVPLIPRSYEILTKYDYKPPVISEQKARDYIKEACHIVGIDSIVEQIKHKGGQKIITKTAKWKLVGTHTAVKTFITHCGQKGISPKVVAEITGKTVKVILDHYYGTDEATIEREMYKGFGKPVEMKAS